MKQRTSHVGTEELDDPRREFLIRCLAMGLFTVGSPIAAMRSAQAAFFGLIPDPLPAERSIYQMEGRVLVNGSVATTRTIIGANDEVKTAPGAKVAFVVGKDAYLIQDESEVKLTGRERVIGALRVVTGRLLSVFGGGGHRITTPVATIGIRGSGVYVESDPELTYVCTCYGTTQMGPTASPATRETVASRYHGNPRYILGGPQGANAIRPAPFKNHTDLELTVLEALVGRAPPFRLFGGSYDVPRRTDIY